MNLDIKTILLSKESLLLLLAILTLGWVSYDGLELMVGWWERDEYSHGYMIPFVAVYLLWQKRFVLAANVESGSYVGVVLLFLALFTWLLGELSAIYTIIQYAFFVGMFALALLWLGVKGTKVVWAPIFYLVFMIPLPNFLYFNLSQELQLISSMIGVAVIRLFDISVYLEGNVIDLGVYQLQVVEACSGLRYLFPLMSFGFLISYIYRGPVWQKIVIFLSTIPITVVMNSFRIGVIGVSVEYFGIAAAEGFLHDFEGWIVFMACLGVLLFEIWLFYLLSSRKTSFGSLFDLDFGGGEQPENFTAKPFKLATPAWIGMAMLVAAIPASMYFSERQDIVPDRMAFIDFPLEQNDWIGKQNALTEDVLDELKLTDYFMGNYKKIGSSDSVNFYTAWYQEQRKGASIHSPKSCLPGGGWIIKSHTIETISEVLRDGESLKINRVNMQMGENNQLVYYWFQWRNRNITNEYLAKWFIFWDSLTRQRTDGALVRLVTFVPEGADIAEADKRLVAFISAIDEQLPKYIPE